MNQTFFFPRWWMMVTRHWAENRRRYLLYLLAVAALMIIWNGFNLLMEKDLPMQYRHQLPTYFIGLFLTGCIFASTLFNPLGNKKEAIQYLSVPASQLEKFLCALLYGVLLFFILYNVLFYLVDIPFVRLSRQFSAPSRVLPIYETPMRDRTGVINVFADNGMAIDGGSAIPVFMLAFFAIQSMFILGSIYFSRFAFIKTVIAVLLLVVAGALYMMKVINPNIPNSWNLDGLIEWRRYNVEGLTEVISPAGWMTSTLAFVVKYTLPVIFWFIAYIRLKEKEV